MGKENNKIKNICAHTGFYHSNSAKIKSGQLKKILVIALINRFYDCTLTTDYSNLVLYCCCIV